MLLCSGNVDKCFIDVALRNVDKKGKRERGNELKKAVPLFLTETRAFNEKSFSL